MVSEGTIILVAVLAIVGVGLTAYIVTRRRRTARDQATLAKSEAERQNTPPSLHPIIDPNICIGSLSCVKACPEGDILGLIDGKATLIEGSHCIGHSRCAIECPVDAIRLVFGSKEKGVDLPETDANYQSSREGVYIIGELGGMGLIKNALRQGLDAAGALKRDLKSGSGGEVVDVAIVGAGPSGIACAVGLKQAGLTHRLLEQDTVGGTVAHYPRGKVVMSETVQIPGHGDFGRSLLSKEELLGELVSVMNRFQVRPEEGTKVEGIGGAPGKFEIKTNKGPVLARRVVLATGLRGSPRKLGVPGEDLPKVVYRLVDPDQFNGKRVLVVGGGDSAVEAAIQLATESTARVTISYRKDSFARAKPRNRELIADLVSHNRLRAVMSSQVQKIEPDKVHIKTESGQVGVLKNDAIIVAIGGEVPTKFLEAVGVSIRRYEGEEKNKDEAIRFKATDNRRLALALFVVGAMILAGLGYAGEDYYLLDEEARRAHTLHHLLKPAGLWGHGVGIVATLFMLSNFIYALRKRWKRLKGLSSIRTWLTFHMFVGIMSPIAIAFHAAFQSNNLLASVTYWSVAIVVGTGIFGRFLFGIVPSAEGKLVDLRELVSSWNRHRDVIEPILSQVTNTGAVQVALDEITTPPKDISLFGLMFYLPARHAKLRRTARRLMPFFIVPGQFERFLEELDEIIRLRVQVVFYRKIKQLFRMWLALHVVLAVAMVALIAIHVAVSIYLGYAWIFSPEVAS